MCVGRERVGGRTNGDGKDELDEKWIDSTASLVSWLDPYSHSLSASPWLPRSDPQFRSYPKWCMQQSDIHIHIFQSYDRTTSITTKKKTRTCS